LCEELNNSSQIEAAANGWPLTRYEANSRSNGAARRVWRLGWRTREFGDLDGERKSLETWRENERVWRAREFGDQGWRTRENGDFAGKARVPSAKADNGTPPDFKHSRERWTGRRSATSRQRSGTQACHKHRLEAVREGQVGQPGGTDLGPGVERSSGPCAKGK